MSQHDANRLSLPMTPSPTGSECLASPIADRFKHCSATAKQEPADGLTAPIPPSPTLAPYCKPTSNEHALPISCSPMSTCNIEVQRGSADRNFHCGPAQVPAAPDTSDDKLAPLNLPVSVKRRSNPTVLIRLCRTIWENYAQALNYRESCDLTDDPPQVHRRDDAKGRRRLRPSSPGMQRSVRRGTNKGSSENELSWKRIASAYFDGTDPAWLRRRYMVLTIGPLAQVARMPACSTMQPNSSTRIPTPAARLFEPQRVMHVQPASRRGSDASSAATTNGPATRRGVRAAGMASRTTSAWEYDFEDRSEWEHDSADGGSNDDTDDQVDAPPPVTPAAATPTPAEMPVTPAMDTASRLRARPIAEAVEHLRHNQECLLANGETLGMRAYRRLEEDKAYSLAGLFDISLAPVYGEGFAQAHQRLLKLVYRRDDCVRDLRLSNPHDDKNRIEHTKGGLLVGAYDWILDHPQYVQWREDGQRRMLWIKGDPDKDKIMLLCGIIDELKKKLTERDVLGYFFCQASDARINNATAVLRGLMLLLVDQQPSLTSHIQEEYDRSGKNLFEDRNTWFALSDILTRMLQDASFKRVCLIIDALDECVAGWDRLLDLIGQTTRVSNKVKWLVSSRNWPFIKEQIASVNEHDEVSLELNADAVSRAVRVFIKHRVLQLSAQKNYSKDLQTTVLRHLYTNAKDTFLWVALSCQYLSKGPVWGTVSMLKRLPPGLDDIYVQMWKHICASDHNDLCKSLLSTITVLYRPATLAELTCVTEALSEVSNDPAAVTSMIDHCGSFLTVREDRVYFVHKSAREFLSQAMSSELYPFGKGRVHREIFSESLQHLSLTLKRDIYSLSAPDINIEDVTRPEPDPLAKSRYSTVYWVAHLCAWYLGLSKGPGSDSHYHLHLMHDFLRSKCLYWLEALSAFVEGTSSPSALSELVKDALRFSIYNKQMIETYPLQVYLSPLLFSPQRSIVRRSYWHEIPTWISVKPAVDEDWSACLQMLEGHSNLVSSVVFSADSSRLASASGDNTVKIWDASSGQCLRTLKGHSNGVSLVVFSADSSRLASASYDKTVKIWVRDLPI
ncbi:hypothetical protein LTR49_025151 [Elasticomyces elasticus]|nr:hypothetical protein LTR49_025151 [Elasticomyces elasticus]